MASLDRRGTLVCIPNLIYLNDILDRDKNETLIATQHNDTRHTPYGTPICFWNFCVRSKNLIPEYYIYPPLDYSKVFELQS